MTDIQIKNYNYPIYDNIYVQHKILYNFVFGLNPISPIVLEIKHLRYLNSKWLLRDATCDYRMYENIPYNFAFGRNLLSLLLSELFAKK